MSNTIKYSEGSESLALNKGNWWIGTGDSNKGPTVESGYWNAINPPDGGYTVYLNKESNGPSIHSISNDEHLISFTNKISGNNYVNVAECLVYYQTQDDKLCVNREIENIVTDGLVLNLDAGYVSSYPKGGNKWYDLSGNNHHFTLYNGPLYDADGPGCVSFDGSNDYAQSDSTIDLTHTGEITVISSFTVPNTETGSVMIYEHTNNWNSTNTYNITGGGTTSYGGFGFVPNSNGTALVPGLNHIQLRGNNSYNGVNAYGVTTEFNVHSVHHLFTSSGFETDYYLNDSYVVPEYAYASSNSGVFGNDYMWLGKRGSGNSNGPCKISTLMIWDRKLSAEELSQVYNSIKNRFGL